MANFTPNVNLEKPLGGEHYLIPKFNANMDKIDVKLGDLSYADRIAYIAEKIRNKNLVTNGDFSDGTTWWTADYGTISVLNNELTFNAQSTTGTLARIYQQFAKTIGKKYYVRFAVNRLVGNVVAQFGGTYTSYYSPNNALIKISEVLTPTTTASYSIWFQNTTLGEVIKLKEISIIDLTTLFGAGNEPTKEETDAAIELLGGWTDVPVADKYLTGYNLGTNINALTSKTTPVDADMVVITDSAASNVSKKLTWSNIKATLKTYFDGLYATVTNLNLKAPLANPVFTGTQTLPNIVTNGIKFPATQVSSADPNTLDDYEEGTWTPIPITSSGTVTSYTEVGRYIKIGNLVHLYCRVHITDVGTASGNFDIGGLPFVEGQPYAQFVGVEIAQTVTLIRAYLLGSTLKSIMKYDGANMLNNNYMYVFNGVYAV